MSENQSSFTGWAIVEVMGRQTYAGYVTTQNFGAASLFRVDTPALPEKEGELQSARYIGERFVLAGTKYRLDPVDGFSKLIGAAAIYAITPCTEEVAMQETSRQRSRPLIPLGLVHNEPPKMLEVLEAETEFEQAEEGDF